ncbi:hypothetical protein ACHAXT_004843 [Thalassiosira profunda]
MALHPLLAKFQSLLISLPFVYGFSNRYWEEMTDYMLEKKPGDRRIHRMRIIGMVCPEFNTALKHAARQLTASCKRTGIWPPASSWKAPRSMERGIEQSSLAYFGDTDGHVLDPPLAARAVGPLVRKLEESAHIWNELENWIGGSVAFHKTNWQFLAWDLVKGRLQLIYETDEELVMKDGKGGVAVIKFLPPDAPNVGLGFRLCPNGDQRPHFEATIKAIRGVCSSISGGQLNESEARQALYQRVIPKLVYALHLTSWDTDQCDSMNRLLQVMSLQDETQLSYLRKEFRWDKSVANAMLTTIDQLQMRVGFVRPIMEFTTLPIRYASTTGEFDGYFLSLRKRLAEIDGSLWLEDAWTPTLQRDGDASIMEPLVQSKLFSPSVLSRANSARLYLRVITIADLASKKGHYIPDGRFDVTFHAGSDSLFPDIPCPPRKDLALLKRCIQRTFCTFAPPYQRLACSMPLDKPLGKWHSTRRNVYSSDHATRAVLLHH